MCYSSQRALVLSKHSFCFDREFHLAQAIPGLAIAKEDLPLLIILLLPLKCWDCMYVPPTSSLGGTVCLFFKSVYVFLTCLVYCNYLGLNCFS